jgi:hypothetical protein
MLRGGQGKRNGTNITIEFKKVDGDWFGAPKHEKKRQMPEGICR